MMTTPTIVRLQRSQLPAIIPGVADSFIADPMMNYLYKADLAVRQRSLQQLTRVFLNYCLPYDHIYTTPTLQGVAAWLPPGQYPMEHWRLLRLGFYELVLGVEWRKIPQFFSLFNALEQHHAAAMPHPHWYLLLLGVSPAAQGQGVGGELIQPILQQADRDQLPCYLETFSERAVGFYQKHGFEVVTTGQCAADAPRYWTMQRQSRG
jgi:ribosomal protein S18 acetylase RimI-like enzyme